ncbi:hypothetical protein [uncultured Psychroserpens sp.]|uniref:hypothetical protein n=1 Tax=uncultured Psychroserpens sp. TaxID=255436 RepID=UPI002624757D|nr:hypothetical protein [uncultured Psychroserpens sp.]
MNKPFSLIFFGFLAVIMSIGTNDNELIPSEIKLIFGVVLIVYGIYFMSVSSNQNTTTKSLPKSLKKSGRSYIFMALGILLLKSPTFLYPDESYAWNIVVICVTILGFAFLFYGLNLFLKGKKDKRESGSIE